MNKYSAKATNAELKDASWSKNCGLNQEGIDVVINSKPTDSQLNIAMWLMDQLAEHNSEVLVAVDDDWNFVVENKTVTIYNTDYGPEADRLDKRRKAIIPFWDLFEHTKGRGMMLKLMNYNARFFYSTFLLSHKSDYKMYKKQQFVSMVKLYEDNK